MQFDARKSLDSRFIMKEVPAQTRSFLFVPTAIAMAVLLAACGSGSDGGDTNVSSSPSPKAQSASVSKITAGADAITDAITRGQNASAPSTKGSTPASYTARGVAPLISKDGIRGDVLLAMFDQKACRGEFGIRRVESLKGAPLSQDTAVKEDTPPVLTDASLNVEAYTYDMDKLHDGRYVPSRVPAYVYYCMYPDIRSYSNPVNPGDYTYSMTTAGRYHTYLTMFYYGVPWITRGVNEAKVDYPLTVTKDQVIIGAQVKLLLNEDLLYNWECGESMKEGRKEETLLNGTARGYQRQALVPFGVLNQWQDAVGNNLRLLLIKGDKANEARLCTHLNSSLAKRLHCVTWQVPADWRWGKELKGGYHYLIEDRSVYAGETGFMYWD